MKFDKPTTMLLAFMGACSAGAYALNDWVETKSPSEPTVSTCKPNGDGMAEVTLTNGKTEVNPAIKVTKDGFCYTGGGNEPPVIIPLTLKP